MLVVKLVILYLDKIFSKKKTLLLNHLAIIFQEIVYEIVYFVNRGKEGLHKKNGLESLNRLYH